MLLFSAQGSLEWWEISSMAAAGDDLEVCFLEVYTKSSNHNFAPTKAKILINGC